jgi:hypothetical protein
MQKKKKKRPSGAFIRLESVFLERLFPQFFFSSCLFHFPSCLGVCVFVCVVFVLELLIPCIFFVHVLEQFALLFLNYNLF